MPEINRVFIRGSNPEFKWRPTQSWMLVGHCGDVPGTNIDAEQTATTVLLDYESYCDSYAVRILACAVSGVALWGRGTVIAICDMMLCIHKTACECVSRAGFHLCRLLGVDQTAHSERTSGAHRRFHQSIHGSQ
jgi:hypothetical protein